MFDVLDTKPNLIRRWLDGDRVAGREAARLYHDFVLLKKIGLEPVRRPEPDDLEPVAKLEARIDLQEQLIRGLLAIAAGEPDPRPNLAPLFDPTVRAEANRALIQKLTAAIEVLKREAKVLSNFEPAEHDAVRRIV